MMPEYILMGVLLLALAFFLVLPFIRGPIRVRLNNSHAEDTHFEPCDDHYLPRDVKWLIADLRDLGFVVRGRWQVVGHSSATAQMTVLEHPQTSDVSKILDTAAGSRRSVSLLFQTCYQDGTETVTANNQIIAGLPALPQVTVLWLPEVRDPRQLYDVHKQAGDALGPGKERRPIGEDAVAFLKEGSARIRAHHVQTGYYFLDKDRGVYRPTWKGAALITWRLLWPIRPLYRAWRRRRTSLLLQKLGVDVDTDD
jgi:hypothetical protein